jgi:KaiC/GvpD/RAD55 family RecA-like ATPase
LGAGHLGVVMSRAGVGKTAFLVQIGLDDLMRQRQVLHVSLGQSVEHVQSWYYALYDDLARQTELENRDAIRAEVGRRSVIQAYPQETHLDVAKLEEVVNLYAKHASFEPAAILVDGWSWEGAEGTRASELEGFKAIARRLGAELWMSAMTHRSVTLEHPTSIPAPCARLQGLIDVGVFLEPHEGANVAVRILKDHDNAEVSETHLELDPDTMRLVEEDVDRRTPVALPPSQYTLLSGAAKGAEAEFGACAEKWGMSEVNFSFAGRTPARRRGLYELSDTELKQGEVSPSYVEAQLHRSFPQTPQFQKMLQTIWHQVATAGEVFVVGLILPDNTVNGGTGWAAELGRHFKKPVHVFDQEKKAWFTWRDGGWQLEERPRITRTRFTGTGTRFLTEEGRQAIVDLFNDSFGTAA